MTCTRRKLKSLWQHRLLLLWSLRHLNLQLQWLLRNRRRRRKKKRMRRSKRKSQPCRKKIRLALFCHYALIQTFFLHGSFFISVVVFDINHRKKQEVISVSVLCLCRIWMTWKWTWTTWSWMTLTPQMLTLMMTFWTIKTCPVLCRAYLNGKEETKPLHPFFVFVWKYIILSCLPTRGASK